MVTETFHNSENSKIGLHNGKEIDFEEALTLTGFGRYNIYLIAMCGLCLFAVNATLYGVGYILPAAECDLNLSTTDKGLLTAVGFIGIICSLYIWGALADTRGRKKIMLISLISSFICTVATVLTASFWLFAVFQFLNGVSISGSSSTLYAYLGEFHNNNRRSGAIAWCTVFMTFAFLILPGLAWITLSQSFNIEIVYFTFSPWRLFVLLCGIPSLLAAIALVFFPESPKYLFVDGKAQMALTILQKMYTANSGKHDGTFPIQPLVKPQDASHMTGKGSSLSDILKTLWLQTVPLFQRTYRKYTAMTCILQFGTFAISSGLLLWFPDILNKLAESAKNNPNSTVTVCEAITIAISQEAIQACDNLTLDFNVFQQNLVIGFAYLIGCSLVGVLINRVGKKLLLTINFFVSGICCILLTIITSPLWVDILFIGVLVPPGLCVAVVNAAVVDLFPTHFKAMAVGLCLLMGRLGSVVASTIIGYLLDLSCNWTFYSYIILAFGCTFLSLFIPSNTYSENIQEEDKP